MHERVVMKKKKKRMEQEDAFRLFNSNCKLIAITMTVRSVLLDRSNTGI
jgi:hypothetical protein